MKNKLLLFFISLMFISFYVIINLFFYNQNNCNENVNDYLYKNLQKEMESLLKENNINYDGYKIIGAKTIERNIYSFFDQIIINRGLNDGVKENDAVVNNEGLVGVIKKVYNTYSEVTLITDENFSASVSINDSYAIFNNGIIKNIIFYNKIEIGDKVFTSGLTNIPSGIYIGEIKELYKNDAIARVEVNGLNDLKFVYVIIGDNE